MWSEAGGRSRYMSCGNALSVRAKLRMSFTSSRVSDILTSVHAVLETPMLRTRMNISYSAWLKWTAIRANIFIELSSLESKPTGILRLGTRLRHTDHYLPVDITATPKFAPLYANVASFPCHVAPSPLTLFTLLCPFAASLTCRLQITADTTCMSYLLLMTVGEVTLPQDLLLCAVLSKGQGLCVYGPTIVYSCFPDVLILLCRWLAFVSVMSQTTSVVGRNKSRQN